MSVAALDSYSEETVASIVDMAMGKIVDWGQETPLGMAGVGEAVVLRLAEDVAQLRREVDGL